MRESLKIVWVLVRTNDTDPLCVRGRDRMGDDGGGGREQEGGGREGVGRSEEQSEEEEEKMTVEEKG